MERERGRWGRWGVGVVPMVCKRPPQPRCLFFVSIFSRLLMGWGWLPGDGCHTGGERGRCRELEVPFDCRDIWSEGGSRRSRGGRGYQQKRWARRAAAWTKWMRWEPTTHFFPSSCLLRRPSSWPQYTHKWVDGRRLLYLFGDNASNDTHGRRRPPSCVIPTAPQIAPRRHPRRAASRRRRGRHRALAARRGGNASMPA